jgi:uncharacterized protein YndB with AHSA1/START domain
MHKLPANFCTMNPTKITVEATIRADKDKVWDYYTNPDHITQWNFADPSWHCPGADNDMKIGGTYRARMEARDGSFGFDFEAVYTDLAIGDSFTYVMPDDREVTVTFNEGGGKTHVNVTFDAETENPVEMQKGGWQAILNNFKIYAETN